MLLIRSSRGVGAVEHRRGRESTNASRRASGFVWSAFSSEDLGVGVSARVGIARPSAEGSCMMAYQAGYFYLPSSCVAPSEFLC